MQPARPRKRFGQNFLSDTSVIERIVAALAPSADDHVIEIGPGEGALSSALAAQPCRLTLIELDRDLVATLPARLAAAGVTPPRLADIDIVQGDALRTDYSSLADGGRLRVVGNLPYNISTPLLFHLLEHAEAVADMLFMLQAEVVARLVATPGSKAWGRLGVMSQLAAEPAHLFDVPPEAFRPPPKVWSSVVRLVPRRPPPPRREVDAVGEVVTRAFAQRRKTLRNALSGVVETADIEALGIDPSARAEALGVEEFKLLASRQIPRCG